MSWQAAAEANRTHGMTRTRTWRAWKSMRDRCRPNSPSRRNYADRGIRVCDRLGESPEGHELDRTNNDGIYEPGNCRWVTPRDNSLNRRSTRLFSLNGETLCATEWAARIGVSPQGLLRRIDVLKWPLDKALTQRNRQA